MKGHNRSFFNQRKRKYLCYNNNTAPHTSLSLKSNLYRKPLEDEWRSMWARLLRFFVTEGNYCVMHVNNCYSINSKATLQPCEKIDKFIVI